MVISVATASRGRTPRSSRFKENENEKEFNVLRKKKKKDQLFL